MGMRQQFGGWVRRLASRFTPLTATIAILLIVAVLVVAVPRVVERGSGVRATALWASVIAVAGVVGSFALQWLIPKTLDTIASAIRGKARSRKPVDVSVTPNLIEFRRFSLAPRAYVVPLTHSEIVAKAKDQYPYNPYDSAWKYEMGGVDAWYTEVQVTIEGRDERPVILQGLEVDVVERRRPLKGVLLQEPGGDLVDVRYVEVDLDSPRPKLGLGSGYLQGEGEWTFPLRVSSTELEVLYIIARTKSYDCAWTARLLFTYRGEARSIEVNNRGKPFRTSSPDGATEAYYVNIETPGLNAAPGLIGRS